MVRLLTEENIDDCPTYVLNAEILIPWYYQESKFDSIYILLDFLEYECGEWVGEFEILEDLLKLDQDSFEAFCSSSYHPLPKSNRLQQRFYTAISQIMQRRELTLNKTTLSFGPILLQ